MGSETGMGFDTDFWRWVLVAAGAIGLLASFFIYQVRARRRYVRACFEAMLRMLLQPTAANIAALDALLLERRLTQRKRRELLYQAEVEADCLSMMPTGESRSSQPFLQRRYTQILATAEINGAVAEMVKARLSSF